MTVLMTSCATLSPHYEQPQVSINSFTLSPNAVGIAPTCNIGLHIVNPNRNALPLQGMSYSVELEGHRVLSGAEPNLPRIDAYSSADIVIQASPDLFGSARLINQLLTQKQAALSYTFKAKLDVGSLLPFITIEESGEFELSHH
jgi:LEA14-like dessication related protein